MARGISQVCLAALSFPAFTSLAFQLLHAKSRSLTTVDYSPVTDPTNLSGKAKTYGSTIRDARNSSISTHVEYARTI